MLFIRRIRLRLAFAAILLIFPHGALMFGIRRGKLMAAVIAGDKIKIIDRRWANRGEPASDCPADLVASD